jgi:uncharacterized protein (TIGR02246 family)
MDMGAFKSGFAIILASATLAACASAPEKPSEEEVRQQILAQEKAWNDAFSKRDGEALAGFFDDEAAVASPGQQLVRGKESIREEMTQFASDENLKVTFKANKVGVADSRDFAYSRGQFLMTATNPETKQPQSSQGYYLTVWKRQQDGSWKAIEDFVTPGPSLPVAERATMIQ